MEKIRGRDVEPPVGEGDTRIEVLEFALEIEQIRTVPRQEAGETVREALARELLEEINLVVEEAAPFLVIDHDYGDKQVTLDVWTVSRFSGSPHGSEGQEIAWVKIADLARYAFPEANAGIVAALRETLSAS